MVCHPSGHHFIITDANDTPYLQYIANKSQIFIAGVTLKHSPMKLQITFIIYHPTNKLIPTLTLLWSITVNRKLCQHAHSCSSWFVQKSIPTVSPVWLMKIVMQILFCSFSRGGWTMHRQVRNDFPNAEWQQGRSKQSEGGRGGRHTFMSLTLRLCPRHILYIVQQKHIQIKCEHWLTLSSRNVMRAL